MALHTKTPSDSCSLLISCTVDEETFQYYYVEEHYSEIDASAVFDSVLPSFSFVMYLVKKEGLFLALVAFIQVKGRQEMEQRENGGDTQQRVAWARSRTRLCISTSICIWVTCPNHCTTASIMQEGLTSSKKIKIFDGMGGTLMSMCGRLPSV